MRVVFFSRKKRKGIVYYEKYTMLIKKRKRKMLIAWLSSVSLVLYFAFRIWIYLGQRTSIVNTSFGVLLLVAEAHAILQSLGFIVSVIRLGRPNAHHYRRAKLDEHHLPGVTIMVPARNEPLAILESTFLCLNTLDYTNRNIVFLDGSDPERIPENAALAKKYHIHHFVPAHPSKNKAEIINAYLPSIQTTYLCVFDADQNPMPDFLRETVPLLEYSRNVAFVQTPQLYANQNVSTIAKGAALQQSIFFESICEGKNESNAMFCCGTNFVMRTQVLKRVGGFDESSVTEDFATSVQIHALGYRSIYYSHVRVFGMAPETLSAYFKQQYRWCGGTVSVIRKLVSLWCRGMLHLTYQQMWEYFLSATYYFTGWSFFILMLCPALYLLCNIPTYFASPYFYIATFVPYYFFTILTFYSVMRERHYSFKDVYMGTIMSSLIFPVLMQSTVAALLNRKMVFHITNKGRGERLPLWMLWPWIGMMVVLCGAIGVGAFRYAENHYAIGINIFWCTYHLLLLGNIFRFNKFARGEGEKAQQV